MASIGHLRCPSAPIEPRAVLADSLSTREPAGAGASLRDSAALDTAPPRPSLLQGLTTTPTATTTNSTATITTTTPTASVPTDTEFASSISAPAPGPPRLLPPLGYPHYSPSSASFHTQPPRDQHAAARSLATPSASPLLSSPMAVDTPLPPLPTLAQGSKRTASGAIKPPVPEPFLSPHRPAGARHARGYSTGSARIGELSAQLKARLSYAMVKVQNGWERHSLEELEELPSSRLSPKIDAGPLSPFEPSSVERRRRSSAMSEGSERYLMSPGQAMQYGVSRSLNATPSNPWPSQQPAQESAAHLAASYLASERNPSTPGLAPAPDIVSRRNRRSYSNVVPPSLTSSSHKRDHRPYTAGMMPTTPVNMPRAGILRMPSQQAEKDAVDTLLFMSSPNNSTHFAHTSASNNHSNSSSQQRPFRSDLPPPPKRVVFDRSASGSSIEDSTTDPRYRSRDGRVGSGGHSHNSRFMPELRALASKAIVQVPDSDEESRRRRVMGGR